MKEEEDNQHLQCVPIHVYLQHKGKTNRAELEEGTTLADLCAEDMELPQERSDSYSCSCRDILYSGALPGTAANRFAALCETKHRRLQAAMRAGSVTVADTKGWRIRAAYRMVCYMARITGDLKGPMSLAHLFKGSHDDPATVPFRLDLPPDAPVYGMGCVREVLSRMDGFTYLPPSRDVTPGRGTYGVDFPLWLLAYDRLATQLRICDGTEDEPEAGVYGLAGMFRENTARFVWPVADELLLFEQELFLHLFDCLCRTSVQGVEHMVMRTLGMERPEAVMLVRTAMLFGQSVYGGDFENCRIRELKSLEIISDTAYKGDDPRAQLAVRKQFQLVNGLTRNDPSDAMEVFRELSGKVLREGEERYLDRDVDMHLE